MWSNDGSSARQGDGETGCQPKDRIIIAIFIILIAPTAVVSSLDRRRLLLQMCVRFKEVKQGERMMYLKVVYLHDPRLKHGIDCAWAVNVPPTHVSIIQ